MTDEQYIEALREQIAEALKWQKQDTYSFSLPSLAAMIRTKKPELYEELLQVIERRLHWFAKPGKAKNA